MGQRFCRCLRTPTSDDEMSALPENTYPHVQNISVVEENGPQEIEENSRPQVENSSDVQRNGLPQVGDVSHLDGGSSVNDEENANVVEENSRPQVENSSDVQRNGLPQVGDVNHLDGGSSVNDEENANLIFQGEDLSHFNEVNFTTLHEVKRVDQLDEVISFIERRLKAILTDEPKESTSAAETTTSVSVATSIKCGYNFIGKVLNSTKKYIFKTLNSETRKVVVDMLRGTGKIHWIVAGIGVVAYVLDQIGKVSSNTIQDTQFLGYMCGLAKQIQQLENHLDQEKLERVVAFIANGSLFCILQMESNYIFRFSYASSHAEELKSLKDQLFQTYLDLTLDGIIRLLNLSVSLPLTMGVNPNAVGIEAARDEVVNLLDLKGQSTKAVVLYGLGGTGKTTLATAVVFSPNLDLSAYKCCKINIEPDCSEYHIKQLQEQVIRDLFNQRIQLRNSEEGENHLFKLLREPTSQPVFLFIDNALRSSDLAKLLPQDLSCLPNRSRVLITTRKLDETDMIEDGGVMRCAYRVKYLSDAASIELLRRKAFVGTDIFFDKSLDIDGLVKLCGGVPQVLSFVGTMLRKRGNNVRACENIIQFLNDTLVKGEGNLITNVVDVVYNALDEDLCKDAFLDIAAFFNNWDERMVGYIVGAEPLEAIKEAALVWISEEGKVIVDSIVEARGRKLSEDDRITNHSMLERVLSHTQSSKKLKGVWLPPRDDSSEFQLQAEHLELMNGTLRVLYLAERNRLEGETKEAFPNLRLLHTTDDLAMEWTKLERLAVLRAYLKKCDGLSDSSCLLNFPGSVYHLELSGYNLLRISENLSNLSHIEELYLSTSSGSLPDGFCQLQSLRFLKIVDCPEMTRLPENFGHLSSLEILNLSGSRLICLPDSFGQLSCLEELNISECRELVSLPQSFSDLSRLKKFNISNCEQLSRLPDEFVKRQNLTYLNMAGCSNLEMASEDFEKLSSVCAGNAPNYSRSHGKAMGRFAASASVTVDEKGKKQVEDTEFTLSVSGNGEGLKDTAGYFSREEKLVYVLSKE